MDRPPPYNPVYEQAAGSFNVSSPFNHNSPEYRNSSHRRSASLRPRRVAPPPPVPPSAVPCVSPNFALSGHGGIFENEPPPPYSVRPLPFDQPSVAHTDWSGYSHPSPNAGFSGLDCSPQCRENSPAGFQNISGSSYRRQSSGSSQRCRGRLRSNLSVPDKLSQVGVPSELERSSTDGIRYRCLALTSFKSPCQLAISNAGIILVIDSILMTVCLFNQNGQKRSEFKVVGVHGGCFLAEQKLALATVRGITICQPDGKVVHEIIITGAVVATKSYNFGFVVVQRQQLMIYGGSNYQLSKTISSRKKSGVLRHAHSFKSITDIAVNVRKYIIVLDGGIQTVFTIDENGIVKSKICLTDSSLTCGPVSSACSVTVDRSNNVIISDQDNRRVLKISPDGPFATCLVDFAKEKIAGRFSDVINSVAEISLLSELYVIVSCQKKFEIRVYSV